ncbi:methyltransferase domain-containing protein [uncultured Roseibium sp.]|uniref:methyltransferase domain-containing protein n=1 Tax=uncultured Roseibium sp. TaxID=1936171 RepID=UPI002639745B|nr:methyltransferase domain-containing protein [uncultured Roseibium sp.]
MRNSFARSQDSYHDNAREQARIVQLLVDRMVSLGAPKTFGTVFEFGCGSGHLSQALVDQFGIASLFLNDLAYSTRLPALPVKASFRLGDVRKIDWPDSPSLIASASTIQWLADPQCLLQRAADALAPGGWLVVSGYGHSQFIELAQLGSTARAPGLCGSKDLARFLRTGFDNELEILEAREEINPVWFDTPLDVLRHLRRTGVNAPRSQVWTRAKLMRFCSDYIDRFSSNALVPLTYHPVWIIARKHC